MGGLLDGFVDSPDWLGGLETDDRPAPPKTTRQYTEAEIEAIRKIHAMDDGFAQAFVRVKLSPPVPPSDKVGKVVLQHWPTLHSSKIPEGMSKWCYIGCMGWEKIEAHIRKPDCILGIVPFRLGLMVADIDRPGMEALEAVNNALGTPLSTFPTASGGWHSLYAIDGIQTASAIQSAGYRIDGVHLGELCCLHRFANCWSPISWLQAVEKRVSMTEGFITAEFVASRVSWIGNGKRRRKDRPERTTPRKPYISEITLQDAIEYFDLRESPTAGEWQGHCPQCDPNREGGGTRFKCNFVDGHGLLLNCFECAEHGFENDIYWDLVKPLERRAHRKRIQETLAEEGEE